MKRFRFLAGLASLPAIAPLAARLAPAEETFAKGTIYVDGRYASGYSYLAERAGVCFNEVLDEANAWSATGARVFVEFNSGVGNWLRSYDLPTGVAGAVSWVAR
jgi:hypothetical protein